MYAFHHHSLHTDAIGNALICKQDAVVQQACDCSCTNRETQDITDECVIRIHVLYNTVRVLPVTRQVGSSALTEILDELYLDDEFEAFRFDLQHLELDDFGYGSAKSAILVLVRLVPRCVAQTRG